jgi:hypothetical protein
MNELLLEIIKEHLNYLLQNLNLYLPKDAQESIRKNYEWIINSFLLRSKPATLNATGNEVLIRDIMYIQTFEYKYSMLQYLCARNSRRCILRELIATAESGRLPHV